MNVVLHTALQYQYHITIRTIANHVLIAIMSYSYVAIQFIFSTFMPFVVAIRARLTDRQGMLNSNVFLITDMAQAMFQVSGLRNDPEHADIQGF